MDHMGEKGVLPDEDMQIMEDDRGMILGSSSIDTSSNCNLINFDHAKLATDLKAYEEVRNTSNMSIIGITKVTDVTAQ